MKTRSRWVVISLIFSIACGVSAAAVDPRLSEETAVKAAELRTAVLAEASAEKAPLWSGDFVGDGVSLSLASKAGFVFERRGVTRVFDRNYGPVTASGDAVHLTCTFPNRRDTIKGIAPDFIALNWGARRYLVAADDIVGFCNRVNQGVEPRKEAEGVDLLRKGDETKPVEGLPYVPADYTSYLLVKPVEASVTSVTPQPKVRGVSGTRYTLGLNAGSDKGLRDGMELRLKSSKSGIVTIRITSVGTSKSEALLILASSSTEEPGVEWKFSTRPE